MTHVLVVGGGGREHALAWKLAQSPHVQRISVAPGNGGIDSIPLARAVDIDATDIVSLLDFAETERVDLTVVGPEEPLAGGLVDQFEAVGQRIFGPRRAAARIETSKSYAKRLMLDHGVPTPAHQVFTDLDDALDYLMQHPVHNLVIKADGLARGKGVYLPAGESDAEGILRALLQRDALGSAGRRVIIEQRLQGDELVIMAFTDGHTIAMMPAARNYKRLYDEGRGPNTGGMGSLAPAPALTPEQAVLVKTRILEPTLGALQQQGQRFCGVLYAGVILTPDGPMALELNARFSDPGAQAVLPLLKTDLYEVIDACITGTLDRLTVEWHHAAAVTVVTATHGYPYRHDPGLPIHQIGPIPDDVLVFHSGTRRAADGTLLTTGGRVIGLTGLGPDLRTAMQRAYAAGQRIRFEGMHFRRDIGALMLTL